MRDGGNAFASIAAVLTFSSASAATVTATTSKENKTIVSLNGEIVEGDSGKLKEIIRSASENARVVSVMRFNSPGGNLAEGVRLAAIVRYAKISTVVGNGAICASACFVAFAAGNQKFVSYTAGIGVHGASDRLGKEAGDATVSLARIIKELGVPEGIIGKMVITPASEITWLSPDDLRSMSVTMTGAPAQTSPAQSTASGLPMKLPPAPAKAILPTQAAPVRCPADEDVHYWHGVYESYKQVIASHPGYRTYVDQVFERQGLGNPANQYTAALKTWIEQKTEGMCK